MNHAPADASLEEDRTASNDRGWYLYGVAEQIPVGVDNGEILQLVGIEDQPISAIHVGRLDVIVSPVSVADYSSESLSAHATDAAWLEAMVRSHNDVIEAVHARGPILPAKFASVFADVDDLRRAFEPAQEALQEQLQRLRGTDEWAIHVYADRAVTRGEVEAQDRVIQELKSQLAGARPGRAFFLQRKLTDELAAATDTALHAAAQEMHDRLAVHAVDYAVNSPGRAVQGGSGKLEILRAAYLVRREITDQFLHAADAAGDDHPGLDVESTGPWPPYSFVSAIVGQTQ